LKKAGGIRTEAWEICKLICVEEVWRLFSGTEIFEGKMLPAQKKSLEFSSEAQSFCIVRDNAG